MGLTYFVSFAPFLLSWVAPFVCFGGGDRVVCAGGKSSFTAEKIMGKMV